MKLLLINEFTRIPGGIDNVVENTLFGLKRYSQISVKIFGVYHNEFDHLKNFSKIKTFYNSKHGYYHYEKLKFTIKKFQPDVIHIHNTYPLISKLIYRIKNISSNTPIIYHLHNFYPFCLNSYFYTNGKICTKCLDKSNWKYGVFKKCYSDSFIQSLLLSQLRLSPIQWIEKSSIINRFIAVSRFVKETYTTAGIAPEKISIIHNPVSLPTSKLNWENWGEYVLFIGRLIKAKGTDVLYRLILDNPDIQFKIAGDGPEKVRFENLTKLGIRNLELLGYVNGAAKENFIKGSKIVIVPSQWLETFGLVVIEANSFGKKVVASKIGGITELVKDGFNGLLCNVEDYNKFHQSVRKLYYESPNSQQQKEIIKYSKKFSIKNYIDKLIALYQEVLSQ